MIRRLLLLWPLATFLSAGLPEQGSIGEPGEYWTCEAWIAVTFTKVINGYLGVRKHEYVEDNDLA